MMMMASDEQQQQLPAVEVAPLGEVVAGDAEGVVAAASPASAAPSRSNNSNPNNNNVVVAIAGHAIRHSVGLLTWCGHAIGEPMNVRQREESGDNDNSNNSARAAAAAAAAGNGSGANQAGAPGAEEGAGAAAAALETAASAADEESEAEEPEESSDEEPETSENEQEEMPPNNNNNNAPEPAMASGSRSSSSSNRMDPLSLLGFAICVGAAFIAGLGVTFDAGEAVSTPACCATITVRVDRRTGDMQPTATGGWRITSSSVKDKTTPPQRIYNINVCECGDQRDNNNNTGTKKSLRLPSPPTATPPTPPDQLSTAGRGASSLLAPLGFQADRVVTAVVSLFTGGRSGTSDGGGGGRDDSSGCDCNGNNDGDAQAGLGFGGYNPWTEEGKAAGKALLEGPWV